MFFRCLSTAATANTVRSKGTIANQENSRTVGDEVGVGDMVEFGVEFDAVEFESKFIVIV